ncbi:MAG: S-layer homology domain-containing protein [Clostridiales bacterium]|nr:S-layer homology domain-containing protein [Clostridiales bacterium]
MKKLICMLLAVLLAASVLPFAVFAADTPDNLPYVTNGAFVFMDYAAGADAATGKSASTAKKGFGTTKGKGAIGAVSKGGTIILSGKAYVGANYTLKVPGTVLFTSKYAGVDYMKKDPASNPDTAFKMKAGVDFVIQSEVIFDDMILFQESATQTVITVENGGTLVIGKNIVTMSKSGVKMKIAVEDGGRLILGGGDFEIENNGGTVYEGYSYAYNKTTQQEAKPEETPDYSGEAVGVGYVDYNNGNNANNGLTPDKAKKQVLSPESNGVLSIVRGGGTLVASGRCYIGADFTIPKLGGYLTITGEYEGKSYVNREPATNPAGGVIKMANGKTLTINTDARLDNLLIFQEGGTQNAICVGAGATVTIGKGVECLTKQAFKARLVVEAGGVAIFEGESPFESVEGDGVAIFEGSDAGKFEPTRIYTGNFTDVPETAWFYTYVKTAYEYALANGTSAKQFSPDGKFTVAQALTAAANIHVAYTGGSIDTAGAANWYDPYVNYCVANGIVKAGQFADYNKNITRGDMAVVFASILPAEAYTAVRDGACPDVTDAMPCAAAVQKLYRAGIVGGDAGTGNYRPSDEIARSEACVIFTRIAAAEYRAK